MPDPRLLLDEPLTQGARIRLDADRSRHLAAVLRLKPGAPLRAFNTEDGEWRARLDSADKRGAVIVVDSLLRASAPTPDLDLLFAPVKRHATDLIVEKATELGARRLRPVMTKRTIADTVRLDRLSLIAREAAEQTERFDAPEILAPLSLSRVLDAWTEAAPRTIIYADESGDEPDAAWGGSEGRAQPLADALKALRGTPSLALLIGPEGGFDPAERRILRALPFVTPVSLGPRILRAETAAIAALAVVQAVWGDWR